LDQLNLAARGGRIAPELGAKLDEPARLAAPGEKSLFVVARPDKAEKKAIDVFDLADKEMRKYVLDIMERLPKALADRKAYAKWLDDRRDHPLDKKKDYIGWRSLDVVPKQPGIAGSKYRFLYKETSDGIKYMIRDTHIR
jgi:hypothetical protein